MFFDSISIILVAMTSKSIITEIDFNSQGPVVAIRAKNLELLLQGSSGSLICYKRRKESMILAKSSGLS